MGRARLSLRFNFTGSQIRHLGLTFAAILALTVAATSHGASRGLTVKDIYHLIEFGDPALPGDAPVFSPSGKQIAFIVKRPLETEKNMLQDYLQDNDVADVWLGDLTTGHVENLTHGAVDGAGFWNPHWSPDGKRIAMLSTRYGNVYLWTWDRTRGLRKESSRAVDVFSPIIWLSNERILCQILPPGRLPDAMDVVTQTPRIATHEWAIARKGKESTASILESGVPADVAHRPQMQLMVFDVGTEKPAMHVLTHAASFSSLTMSPDNRFAAEFSQVGVLEPRSGRSFQSNYDAKIYRLSIYDVNAGVSIANFPLNLVGISALSWSQDGKEVAVFGEPATTVSKSAPTIFRCVIATGTCSVVLPASLDVNVWPASFSRMTPLWTNENRILVYAKTDNPQGSGNKSRWDWYSLNRNGTATNMTASLSIAPRSLAALEHGSRFVGLTGGKLTEVFPSGKPAEILSITGLPPLTTIVSSTGFGEANSRIVATAEDAKRSFFIVDLRQMRSMQIAKVTTGDTFNAFNDATASTIFIQNGRNGSFLRYEYERGPVKTLYYGNAWLSRIATGRTVHFTYESLDSEKLNGWILLPIGYRTGRRYPAIVLVYGGKMVDSRDPGPLTNVSTNLPLNMQLLAAHGYAVILPSMPLPPFGQFNDPYDKLATGVLPAIDETVRLGYVDKQRIGVMGQSYGGFSAYGLVTQTDRFRAAVALAGISDWASLYGTFDARWRYRGYANEYNFQQILTEETQGNFGGPPWVNPVRYSRNSPITYVDRVHTPILIIQGDLDYVPIQQGEEFFSALYRQGKRAEFVRYWGEEHGIRGEANVVDCWKRIFAWFDQFLRN